MAVEMINNVIIPVNVGEVAAAQNTNSITKYLRSKSRKFHRWIAAKVQEKGGAVEARSRVRALLVQLQPVVVMVREQDLGKLVFNMGMPLTIGLIVTSAGKSETTLGHFVLAGLSSGCALIFTGILYREAFPETAKAMEHVGIALGMTSFNGLVASALPPEFAWVPVLSACCCVPPLLVAALPHDTAAAAAHDFENTPPGAL